jgi:hypothetical protein
MKNLKRSVLLFFIVVCQQLNAQDWKFIENRAGGNGSNVLVETYDKGYLFPVVNFTIDDFRFLTLYKLNHDGELLWTREFTHGPATFEVNAVFELKEGGYLVGGATNALDNQKFDPFIMRLNACMEPEWFRIFKETEQDNRLDEIIEYKGQYLLTFSYLKSNFITLAMMDKTGHINKNLTLDSINSENIRISDNGQIRLVSDVGFLGKFTNPFLGTNTSVVYDIDSNLNVTNTNYYFENDTLFPNMGIDLCYIGENREDYLALITDRGPRYQSTVTISRNLDENSWAKNINDTLFVSAGINILRIDTNRYAISSVYVPDNNEPLEYIGLNYIIDSNANVIHKTFENPNYKVSLTSNIIKTTDGKIMTVGAFSNNQKDYSIYCYQYNQDLSFAQKSGVVRRYDSLCPHAVVSQKITLPEPEIYLMDEDQFVSIEFVPGITRKHFVCPNPSSEKKYHFNQTIYDEVDVYNASGVLIKTLKSSEKGLNEIDLSELQSGIYFIMIKGMFPIKVVVE